MGVRCGVNEIVRRCAFKIGNGVRMPIYQLGLIKSEMKRQKILHKYTFGSDFSGKDILISLKY